VVEDNADLAETFDVALALDSHSVRTAQDGPAVRRVVDDFDVVLLDVGLSGMSGYEVARRLRRDTKRSALKIIALSRYGQEEHRTESRQAGCDAHLVKPVDPGRLPEDLGGESWWRPHLRHRGLTYREEGPLTTSRQ
jgi:two-component system CheB/CheR fusion protein